MKILIIEDELHMRDMLRNLCEKEHFTVDTASTAYRGEERLAQHSYDLVLLDLNLPDRSGFELLADLRKRENNTPVIIVSQLHSEEERVKGLNMGADDYVVKDFSETELIARIKSVLRRQGGPRHNTMKCNDLQVNMGDLSVYRNETKVDLAKKEFGILVELIRNKNTVVTREQIVESVWGERDVRLASNAIDVHIRSLRQKIDKPFPEGRPLIQTVRGYGYMISDAGGES